MAENSHVLASLGTAGNGYHLKFGLAMKIGVLSDTHISDKNAACKLADILLSGPFADVEAIFHAGDAIISGLENYFYPLPWYAVRGNMDTALHRLPISRIVKLADKKIGLIHGWGPAAGIEQRVLSTFYEQKLDVLIFGHSHQPVCRRVDSVLLLNPGSATDRRGAEQHTVAVLTIEENISAEIIPID